MIAIQEAAERLIGEVNQQTGCDLTLLNVADRGETSGAAFVVWPDGRRSVVTLATVSASNMHVAAEVMELAHRMGLSVPRFELVVQLDHERVAIVQERLSGVHATYVDADLVDVLVAENDRFEGLLDGRPDIPVPPLHLAHGGSASRWHETLAGYNDRSRRLLRQIEALGADDRAEMTGQDLLHTDFTLPNILLSDDRHVSGIVDWNNGVFRGDRRFALVKLLFDLTWDGAAPHGGRHHIQPCALNRLEAILHDTVDADTLQLYWAHWTLTMLHWTIRSGEAEAIDLHLSLGERGLS